MRSASLPPIDRRSFLASTAPLDPQEIRALRALAEQPYRAAGEPADARLLEAANHWIRRHR